MPGEPALLRNLITARHWQRYETFTVQFERSAGSSPRRRASRNWRRSRSRFASSSAGTAGKCGPRPTLTRAGFLSASSLAAEAVAAYEQAPENEKSFGDEAGSRTDLAIARARAGNLEGAREAIQPVLDLPVAQRIHGVVTSVLNVHRAVTVLAPDAPAARDIQEEIEDYCRTPAAALPR